MNLSFYKSVSLRMLMIFSAVFLFLASHAQVKPAIEWQKVYGGADADVLNNLIAAPAGGFLAVGVSNSNTGYDKSENKTTPSTFNDFWLVRTDAAGNKLWDKTYGSTWTTVARSAVATADGGFIVLGNISKNGGAQYISGDPALYDVSVGDLSNNAESDMWVLKVDANGNKLWDNRFGSTTWDNAISIAATPDGGFVLAGYTDAVTANNSVSENTRGSSDYWIVKINASGQKMWDKRYGGGSSDQANSIVVNSDGTMVILGESGSGAQGDRSEPSQGGFDYWVLKLDAAGNKLWDRRFGGTLADNGFSIVKAHGGGYLLGGASKSRIGGDKSEDNKSAPTTTYGDYWLVRIDENGNKLWDKTIGGGLVGDDILYGLAVSPEGGYYLTGRSSSTISGDRTDINQGNGNYDNWVVKIDNNGIVLWDKALGGINDDYGFSIVPTTDGGLVAGGYSDSPISGNKTENTRGGTNLKDYWLVKLGCALSTEVVTNDISPATQTACILGTPQTITGTNDVAIFAPEKITYQWQVSSDGVNGWTDIVTGITKDYLPEPSSNTLYYRRIARWACNHSDISNVVAVVINANIAPTVTAGGPFFTCPGSAVTLGGSPTATGGTSPYTYSWDNAGMLSNATVSNPVATINTSAVFTLTVTDGNGCKKIGQSVVTIPKAAVAGPDVYYCAGSSGVQIGTVPTPGLTNVTYSWSPATGLSSTSIAQPVANPSSTTTYNLTMTFTNSAGATCTYTDGVLVTVAAPPAANFAGADQVVCSGGTALLGTTSVAGYTYTWSPGAYLMGNASAQTTFNPGTAFPPAPNPITYTVTASNATCTFTDQVIVANIRAYAGPDQCGPTIIGVPDATPNINETYQWTKLGTSTGSGNIIGASNTPQVTVSNASTGTDYYQIAVTYNGITCTDVVAVGGVDCHCQTDFLVQGGNCPLYKGAPLMLIADGGGTPGYTYSWSPSAGLTSTTGAIVYLLDGVNRTYTLTKTSVLDPTDICTAVKEVNNPSWSYPTFVANNAEGCIGDVVSLGQTAVSGYSYLWSGPNSYTSVVANPSLTLAANSQGNYAVKVTDAGSGCFVIDTSLVLVKAVTANAGPDWVLCSNGIVQLGTADPSNGTWTYSWTPAAANWQSPTNQNSAQPEALVAANTTFNLTVTNPVTGCSVTDAVDVTINPNPTLVDAPDVTVCPGSLVKIGSPAFPGVTYSWTPATGLDNPSIAQPTATAGAAGTFVTYTVTAIFPGSCAVNPTDQITVTAFNPNFNLGSDITYCPSAGAVSIGANVPVSGVSSYSWSPSIGLSSTSVANPTTTVTTPTEYTLTVIYTNGCSASGTVNVVPTSTPDAGLNKTICFGSNTTIGSSSNTGTIAWSGTGTAYLSSTTAAQPVFNLSGTAPAATYTLTLTQTVSGCIQTDNVTVIVSPLPLVTGSNVTICDGGSASIGVAAQTGFSYNWLPTTGLSNSTAATTTVTLSGAGTYKYTLQVINNASGCTATAPFVVTVLPVSAPQVSIPPVLSCRATPTVLNSSINPSAGNYSYVWSPATGLSNPFIAQPTVTVSSTTSYTLTVTDNSTGCNGQTTGTVTIDQGSNNFIAASPASSRACESSFVVMSITLAANGSYTYQWQISQNGIWTNISNGGVFNGATSAALTISNNTGMDGAGIRVLVTSQTGCMLTDTSAVAAMTVIPCAALPVTLLEFKVKAQNGHTVLDWKTSSESNSDRFEIQRSGNGISFTVIGSVQAAVNSYSERNYSFRDVLPLSGTNYYRLKMIDKDGKSVFSPVRLVKFGGSTNVNVMLVPNPASSNFKITGVSPGEVLVLHDATGRALYYRTVSGSVEEVDISRYASGMFIIELLDKDGQRIYRGKLIKK